MTNVTRQILAGSTQRSEYGCIVTFENDAGKRLVLHRGGSPEKGLREACAIALSHDESFRVISYSTPQTIFTDLDGGRSDFDDYQKDARRPLPERLICGQIGMSEMCHPRLRMGKRG